MMRVRFAPSPTGSLHIGGVRTALYNFALAQKHGGEFVLRIEDTDLERYQEGSIEEILQMLRAYQIPPDRYPSPEQIERRVSGGFRRNSFYEDWLLHREELSQTDPADFTDIYIQTLRLPLYQKYALELLDKGAAYLCFCSEERLKELRESQLERGLKPGYDGHCRSVAPAEAWSRVEAGESCVVRLDVAAFAQTQEVSRVSHRDHLMGSLNFDLTEVDDQVLIKSNGVPTYHLAVVVDDYLMEISHPIRAVEWISSTPKQIILYSALGWEMPSFTHVTAILDPDGGKLSKRSGSVAARDFLQRGYLPAAMLNFLMLLGWSPGNDREVFSLEEFVEEFSLEGLTKSNPIFDRQKLDWFNGLYIRERISPARYKEMFREFVPDAYRQLADFEEKVDQLAPLFRERLKCFGEVPELVEYFFSPVDLAADDLAEQAGSKEEAREIIAASRESLRPLDEWVDAVIEETLRNLGQQHEWSNRQFFMTLRVAATGETATPPLFETLAVLGRPKTLERLDQALKLLG